MREARAFMISRRVDVAPPSAARELREFGLRRGRSAHAPVSASRVSSPFGVRPHRRPLRVSGACLHLAHNCSHRLLPPQLATTEAAAEKFRKKTPVLYHVGFSSVLSFHTRSVSQSGQFRCGPPALTTPSAHLSRPVSVSIFQIPISLYGRGEIHVYRLSVFMASIARVTRSSKRLESS